MKRTAPGNAAVVIPTLNPGDFAAPLCAGLRQQTCWPLPLQVVDSGSPPAQLQDFAAIGGDVTVIDRRSFNHGGTRQMAIDRLPQTVEFVVLLTQDAVPVDADAIAALLAVFADPAVGMAYGRQLPHPGAGPFGSFARLFNYPAESAVRELADAPRYGLKTAFASNSFAAYRRSALQAVGGFPSDPILGEDTIVAARMLLAGWKVAYAADARVFHSHDYSIAEELRRYFDIGVLHARESWLRAAFGQAEGEGGRFVREELKYLRRRAPWLLPLAIARTGCKYIGYRLGLAERRLPLALKRRLSMHKGYWSA